MLYRGLVGEEVHRKVAVGVEVEVLLQAAMAGREDSIPRGRRHPGGQGVVRCGERVEEVRL